MTNLKINVESANSPIDRQLLNKQLLEITSKIDNFLAEQVSLFKFKLIDHLYAIFFYSE